VGQSGRAEAFLGVNEPLIQLAEQVFFGHANVLVADFGVETRVTAAAHVGYVADHIDAVGVRRHEKERTAFVGVSIRIGPREDDQDVGLDALCRPPLVAVDDPLVAIPFSRRPNHLRIRSRTLHRLGHREAGLDVARDQRLEIGFFL